MDEETTMTDLQLMALIAGMLQAGSLTREGGEMDPEWAVKQASRIMLEARTAVEETGV